MFNKITYVTGKDHEAMSEVAGSGIYVAGRRISVMSDGQILWYGWYGVVAMPHAKTIAYYYHRY